MLCYQCGTENPSTFSYCQQCGANLEKEINNYQYLDSEVRPNNVNQIENTPSDPFLTTYNLSRYWYCPNDRTKMKNVQHKYVSSPIFLVSRTNVETSIQNAVGVYKIPHYAVPQAIELAKAILDHTSLTDIELVGVQCPTCKLGAAAPKLPRVESLTGNYGLMLYHETIQREVLQKTPYYALDQPLTPNALLWVVIVFFGFIGIFFIAVGLIIRPFVDWVNTTFIISVGIVIVITAYGLYKINENFRFLALVILGSFGFILLASFNIIIFLFVIFPGYVLGFDRVTKFLFKEQSRRKKLLK